ncbi:MAG TPA: SNF2-related protein, partial [Nitrososphaera sp.]|nr:SNF2-related protein [Nitrososphaera sp.]
MLLIESRWLQDSGGIPAFLGARIHPMGHQLYAARRVLWDRVPRFILADEVGLGKTIEAGLIIQALKAEKPELRVLVITPGSMARQWQTELYLRFGAQAYVHIDSSSLQKIPKANWKDVLKSANLIVTATALQTFKEARQILTRQQWDLVIIDEAHQFPPGTEFYSFLHTLASTSHGLLALSATPSKREITSLAGLLALVSPEIYKPEDHDSLALRISIQRDVWDRLTFTSKYLAAAHNAGTSLEIEDLSYLAEQWEGLLPDDEIVMSLVSDLKSGRAAAADNLIAYVQEFHRLDHRIIRTRRITLEEAKHHWSKRTFELIEYEPDSDEAVLANHLEEFPHQEEPDPSQLALRGLYYRVFNSTPSFLLAFLKERQTSLTRGPHGSTLLDPIGLLTADPGPADEELLIDQIVQTTPPLPDEANWLSIALGLTENWKEQRLAPARTRAVCKWLRHHLDESPKHQVILFAQDSVVVVELMRDLQSMLPDIPVKSFHHGINESDLARVALQFQNNKDCRILVSDELGGEGRNFQNASALIHFDLPWSVSRIEQRIGRLDRVGRGADRPVNSIVLCGPSQMEQAIFAVHSGVFKVLTKSAGGIEYALPRFQRDLNQAICHGTEQVHELATSLSNQVDEELQNVDEAFELSLDASKLQLNEAHKLAEWLNEESDSKEEAQILTDWARKLGINTRRQQNDAWEFKWTVDELQRKLKTFPPNGFITGTFDRLRALTDDTQQFLSPGHPLVNALTADLHNSAEGRTTVMFLKLGATYRGRLFALILCGCTLDKTILESPGLMLRAQRFLWPEIQPRLFELHLDQTPSATLVTDASLTTALRSPTAVSKDCKLVPPNMLNEGLDNIR